MESIPLTFCLRSFSTCSASCTGKASSQVEQISESSCQECIPGQYTASAGNAACAIAAPGTYVAGNGGTLSPSCPVGTYSDQNSQSSCKQCPQGKYNTESGQAALSDCNSCEAGTYNDQTGQPTPAACKKCTAGRYSTSTSNTALSDCVECATGKYTPNTGMTLLSQCLDCAAGKYIHVAGSAVCTDCPIGTYNDRTARTALSDCVACGTGTYNDQVGAISTNLCKTCRSGKYNGDTGSTSESDCKACSPGFFSSASARVCSPVTAGHYADATKTVIIGCTKGSYVATTSESTCTLCPKGWHQDSVQQSACKQCVTGKYTNGEGSITCIQCVAGKYADTVATTDCKACMSGQYAAEGASLCIPGAAGTYVSDGQTSAVSCAAGTFSRGLVGDCAKCPIGYSQNTSGAVLCYICPSGKGAPLDGMAQCSSCSAGKYSNGGVDRLYVDVLSGITTVVDAGTSVCTNCNVDYINSMEGASRCLPCDKSNRQTTLGRLGQSLCVTEEPMTFTKPSMPFAVSVVGVMLDAVHVSDEELQTPTVHDYYEKEALAKQYQRSLQQSEWPRYVNYTWEFRPLWEKKIYNNVTGTVTTITDFTRPTVEFVLYWSTFKDMNQKHGPFRTNKTSLLLDMQRTIPLKQSCPLNAKMLDDSLDLRCVQESVDVRKTPLFVQMYVSLNTYDFMVLNSPVSQVSNKDVLTRKKKSNF